MTVTRAWLRLELRRRWRSLVVLALLVAFASGTVLTAVAGARRGETAVDRLRARALPATVGALPNQPGFDWDAVRALPEVEALSTFILTAPYAVEIAGKRVPDDALGFVMGDDEIGRSLDRPAVLEGRFFDSSRADEVVITPRFKKVFGVGVGDVVTIRLYAPKTVDKLAFADTSQAEPDGPSVQARIVGVGRSALYQDEIKGGLGGLQPSAGLYSQYPENLVGTSGQAVFNAWIRLRGGEAAIQQFKADLERVSRRSDIDLMNLAEQARHAKDVTGFEADALWLFALAAGIAAVLLVGQSIARYAAATAADLQVLRAVGMTPAQSAWAAAAGPTLTAMAGTAAGLAGAAFASRWFPIGTASVFEPAPGVDANVAILAVAAVAVPAAVAVGASLAAWLALRSARSGTAARRSAIATATARAGMPVPVVVGTRFALEPGRGRQAIPVRPALVGSVVGVLGVLAALTLSNGVDDAIAHPARFGQVHQLEAFVGISGDDFAPVDKIKPVIAADRDVVSVNDTRIAVAEIEHIPVTLFTVDANKAPWAPVVTEGRLPAGLDEVALASGSAKAMGVSVGDRVAMTGTRGVRQVAVSGLAFVPEGPHNNYVTGGWVTASGYDALFDPHSKVSPAFKYHILLVALRPGVDAAAAADRIDKTVRADLIADGADPAAADTSELLTVPAAPSSLQEVEQIRALPLFLAGFLALLAIGAVGHALATAVRRRRRDVAVLRAVGMTRMQSRGVVVTQATVLALVGLAAGVPLGVALGRIVWRYVADTTPLFYIAPVALLALVLIAPAALLAANLLAVWPGRLVARLRIGHTLRAE